MKRVLAVLVATATDDGVRASAVVVDAADGRALAEAVCVLTASEADIAPRPVELALRGAFAALPGVARGIVDAVVVAGPSETAARIAQDLGKPAAAIGPDVTMPEDEELREAVKAASPALRRAQALLR